MNYLTVELTDNYSLRLKTPSEVRTIAAYIFKNVKIDLPKII